MAYFRGYDFLEKALFYSNYLSGRPSCRAGPGPRLQRVRAGRRWGLFLELPLLPIR